MAIDDTGAVRAQASASSRHDHAAARLDRQRPGDWWQACRASIIALGTQIALRRRVGLTGQMHGSVFLDAEREVIRPALLWNDQRTAAESDEIERTIGFERLVRITGSRSFTGFTVPKLLWLRRSATIVQAAASPAAAQGLPAPPAHRRACDRRRRRIGHRPLRCRRAYVVGRIIDALDLDRAVLPSVVQSYFSIKTKCNG